MDLVQHGDTIQLPGRAVTAAVALSSQHWIVGTSDGTLMSIVLDSRGSKNGPEGRTASTTTTYRVVSTTRLAGRINELMVVALDEGSILLCLADDEPYLVFISTSLQTTHRTIPKEDCCTPTDSSFYPASPDKYSEHPSWMACLQWHTPQTSAVALRADDTSKFQVLVVLLCSGHLKLFQTDDPDTPVELNFVSQLYLPHLVCQNAPRRPNRIAVGGLSNNVVCIVGSDAITFVRIGRERTLAIAATLDLNQRLLSPRRRSNSVAGANTRNDLIDNMTSSISSSPENAATSVIRFLQGIGEGLMMKGDVYRENVCVDLPNDQWLVDVGGTIVAMSSFGAVSPPDFDQSVPQHEQTKQLMASWREMIPSELVLQAVPAKSLLLVRKVSKDGDIEIFSRRRRKEKECLQIVSGWQTTQMRDFRLLEVTNHLEGELIGFAISERGGLVSSLELRRPLPNVIHELEMQGHLETALLLLSDSETELQQKTRLKLAERELKAGYHYSALAQIELGCDAGTRAATALQLREKLVSSSWKRKANSKSWANFLLKHRPIVESRLGHPEVTLRESLDEAILEAICVADSSAKRVLAFLESGCNVESEKIEAVVTSKESSLSVREQNFVLLQLYKKDGNHHRVLQLLETSPDGGVEQVIDHMDSMLARADDELSEDVADTIYNHLGYVLEEAGHDVGFKFLTCGSLPFDKSVGFLRHRRDQKFLLRFLERVHKDPFCACETRSKLVLFMIIEELTKSVKSCPDDPEGKLCRINLRKRLNFYLKYLEHPSDEEDGGPELVLPLIPDSLYEERAFILGLLHREQEALEMLLFEGHCLEAAEELCSGLSRSDLDRSLESVLQSTLRRIAVGTADEERVSTTASFLGRFKHFDIQNSTSFHNLPGTLPISNLRSLLISLLSASNERMQEARIQIALLKAESMRLHQELLAEKKRFCMVDKTSVCQECFRPIGDAAFALRPGGAIMHYSCFRKQTKGNNKKRQTP